jgi:parallel beta-helix repeat protein
VWIAARMGENILPMECSDPQYRFGYALDYAADNIVRDNTFANVTYGVRVEDDGNTISGNHFSGDATQQAVVVGTRYRTTALDRPVSATKIIANTADIPANPEPYRWLYRHTGTDFAGNTSLGEPAQLCAGVPPWTGPFVMTQVVRVGGSTNPPTEPPRPVPAPETLPPCPCAGDCSVDGQVTVDEILRGVTLALGEGDVFACAALDVNADAAVTVDELLQAIVSALEGC